MYFLLEMRALHAAAQDIKHSKFIDRQLSVKRVPFERSCLLESTSRDIWYIVSAACDCNGYPNVLRRSHHACHSIRTSADAVAFGLPGST